MAAQFTRFLLNGGALAAMAYGYLSMNAIIYSKEAGDWMLNQRGGLSQFLTMWTLFVSFLTTALALQEAALPLAPLTAVRRMLAIVSVPMSMVVFAIYWPLVLFAPSLMAPADMAVDEQGHPSPAALMFPLPLGIDLGLHAVPVIILLTDWAVYGKRYSRFEATRVAPLIAIAMGCSYGTWVEWCASANGAFPYPFLNILFVGRLSIYATATLFAFSAFRWVNSMHPASRAITR